MLWCPAAGRGRAVPATPPVSAERGHQPESAWNRATVPSAVPARHRPRNLLRWARSAARESRWEAWPCRPAAVAGIRAPRGACGLPDRRRPRLQLPLGRQALLRRARARGRRADGHGCRDCRSPAPRRLQPTAATTPGDRWRHRARRDGSPPSPRRAQAVACPQVTGRRGTSRWGRPAVPPPRALPRGQAVATAGIHGLQSRRRRACCPPASRRLPENPRPQPATRAGNSSLRPAALTPRQDGFPRRTPASHRWPESRWWHLQRRC